MEDKLKELKLKLSGLLYSRDIEDIVFDKGGVGCPRYIIDMYMHNASGAYVCAKSFDINDTKHFTLSYSRPPDNNRYGISISVYYFREIIIIEEQQQRPIPDHPKYSSMRHYFTPDILLFLKHFHKPECTESAMGYVRQNPHYFKHHTTDTGAIIKYIYDTVEEIVVFNNAANATIKSLELENLELEQENQNLKAKIIEMEENAKRSESPIKLKIE